MSRLPRHLEHLRTGFTAEAVSAATFRAFAEQAASDGKPNLARRWRALADEKDRLAIELLRAAGKVAGEVANLRAALAEEQYEVEVLYPRLRDDLADLGHHAEVELMDRVRRAQEKHQATLDELRRELTGATRDVGEAAPAHAG
jgi:rubrerythrin